MCLIRYLIETFLLMVLDGEATAWREIEESVKQ